VFLSHVLAQTDAHLYRLYMKAVICEIIGYVKLLFLMKIDNNLIYTVITRRSN